METTCSKAPADVDFSRVAIKMLPGREVAVQNFQKEVTLRILRGDHTLLDARPGVYIYNHNCLDFFIVLVFSHVGCGKTLAAALPLALRSTSPLPVL